MKKLLLSYLLLALFVLCLPMSGAAQTTADVAALIKDAVRNGKGTKFFISDYTHTQTIIERTKDKKGNRKETSDTWEAYMPTLVKYNKRAPRWVRIKIKENGQPLPLEKIEKERKNATEKLIESEEKASKLATNATPIPAEDFVPDAKGAYFNLSVRRFMRGDIAFSIPGILENFDFSDWRTQTLNGRATIALYFAPKPGIKFSDEWDYYDQLSGTMWFDAADRIVVKVEGWPLTNIERKSNPIVFYEAKRVAGDKWLPYLIRLNGLEYKSLLRGLDREIEATLTDYQRFDSEIQEVKIKAPK